MFTVTSTLMIYGLALQQTRLLILPRVIHGDQRMNVWIYDHEYDDKFDPEE